MCRTKGNVNAGDTEDTVGLVEHSLPGSDIEIVSSMRYGRGGSSTDIAAPNIDKIQPRDGAFAVTD